MKKILFIYDNNHPERLKEDGLWKALDLFEKDFSITRTNIAPGGYGITHLGYDFIFGWGGFTSVVDEILLKAKLAGAKTGLCLSAYFPVNETAKNYDIIFCETENTRMWLDTQGIKQTKHAFGVNTEIFKKLTIPDPDSEYSDEYICYPKVWDYISVGSFSKWHRYDLLYDLSRQGIVVGEIDPENMQEGFNYIANLLLRGWRISNWVSQQELAQLYNLSRMFRATADFGQERAILEARSCGLPIECPDDNPKLKELLTSPIWDVEYYAKSLKEGIESCL